MQKQLVFFTNNPPSPEARKLALDPDNPISPYFGIVGNRKAIQRLIRLDFHALGQPNHDASSLNIALLGGPGSGKTNLVRRHMKANRLPSLELSPKAIRKSHDIFTNLQTTLKQHNIPLTPYPNNTFIPPPVNVFIDEVHALLPNVVQALLKATEPNDRILITEENITLNCKYVHWIIATTDRGKLFDAFDTRFSKIQLELYTKSEIAKIVSFNFPHMPEEAATLAAHYAGKIPREAIAFANEMNLEHNMTPNDWLQIAHKVAQENDIDQHGMTRQRLNILITLAKGPQAANRLPNSTGCKLEELERFILPWLLESTPDSPPLIYVSNKGYALTQHGINELNKRNILTETF